MRRLHDIHGGVHPPSNKAQSLTRAIARAPLPEELVLPLSQHAGAPSEPIVTVGDQVLKGQMIARAAATLSVALHAPTSGEIVAIAPRPLPHPSGMDGMAIVLRADGADRWIERTAPRNWRERSREEALAAIRDAGIAGLGGAGFPTAVKLAPGPARRVRTLILNGAECEPYITADESLMIERAAEVVEGARIIAWLLDAEETLIAIEDDKPRAIAAMRAAADPDQEVVAFPAKYPSGGERQLIRILTGMEVPAGKLPADIGASCHNVGTAAAVYRALVHAEPLISRIVTVTGGAVTLAGNVEVLLGTPMRVLLDIAGCDRARLSRLLMGGPMMGFALPDDTLPVIKTTNCVLAATAGELTTEDDEGPCIRCGQCSEACPASLLPQQLYWYARAEDHAGLEKHHLFDCIECGACAWACPADIPLVQYFRASKSAIHESREQQGKAEVARQRFEQRQARLEREERARETRRKERKAAAPPPGAAPVPTPGLAAAAPAATAAGGKAPREESAGTVSRDPTVPATAPCEPAVPVTATSDAAAQRAREVEAAIERARAKKLANTQEPTHSIVSEAIERARQQALERAAATPAAAPQAPAPRAVLQNRLAVTEKKLLRSAEKLAEEEASVNPDQATLELLNRTRADLLKRRDTLRVELGMTAPLQD